MVAIEAHHDNTAKSLLGMNIQTGTAAGDLDMALRTIETFQSLQSSVPNVAPFVSLRLIQHLVTSNPDPAYVSRIAKVLAQSGGDLKQTVTAILTDTAAGVDGAKLAPSQGHLSEPILYAVRLLRALNASVVYAPPLSSFTANMGQDCFSHPAFSTTIRLSIVCPERPRSLPNLRSSVRQRHSREPISPIASPGIKSIPTSKSISAISCSSRPTQTPPPKRPA